jgi:hypothetical protein
MCVGRCSSPSSFEEALSFEVMALLMSQKLDDGEHLPTVAECEGSALP